MFTSRAYSRISAMGSSPRAGAPSLYSKTASDDRRRNPASRLDTAQRQQHLHAPRRQFRIGEQPGLVRQPEQLGEMQGRARTLLPADHRKMALVAVEPGHEHDS